MNVVIVDRRGKFRREKWRAHHADGAPLPGRIRTSVAGRTDARMSCARGLFESLFRRMKVKPPMPTVESDDLAVIRGLLLHTDMLAVLSAQQLHYECEAGLLAVLDVPMRETTRDIGLMTRAGSPPSPAARALIDAVRIVATEVARTQHASAAGQ